MKNVVLTRIDDRLLHGQVVVSWIPFTKANEIIVIDNEYAQDEFMAGLIRGSATDNIKVNVMTIEETAQYINSENNETRIMLLSRCVENINELINLNVKLDKINLGGLGYSQNRKKIINAVYLSDNELKILKILSKKGIKVELQVLPNEKAIDIAGV